MPRNAGIDAQRGFEYQKEFFLYYAITKLTHYKSIIFEGRDDIETANGNCEVFHSVIDTNDLIQVKSGHINDETFYKVICNWLLNSKDTASENFVLVLENDYEPQAEWVDAVIDFIKNGADKKRTSIQKQVYLKYSLSKKDETLLKDDINAVANNYSKHVFNMSNLEQNALDEFSNLYCADIVRSKIARVRRHKALKSRILEELSEHIKNKKPYKLEFSVFQKYVGEVTTQITDKRYSMSFDTFKKNNKIANDATKREVRQLRLLGQSETFVQTKITEMYFYDDLRAFYAQTNISELNDLEGTAYANHEKACIDCALENDSRPLKVFLKTISQKIDSPLISALPSTSYYNNGCYIYLTKDDAPSDKQITWGDEDNE